MRVDAKGNIEAIHELNIKNSVSATKNNLEENNQLNQDRVEISETASSYDELATVKDQVVKEVEAPTSPDKLRSLKAQIENGTYNVSSNDIAAAILGTKSGAEEIDEG
jgi:anti-sigma28 factor (negative regulator of flagellin synthesis)